jgi:hypothetical protein
MNALLVDAHGAVFFLAECIVKLAWSIAVS